MNKLLLAVLVIAFLAIIWNEVRTGRLERDTRALRDRVRGLEKREAERAIRLGEGGRGGTITREEILPFEDTL